MDITVVNDTQALTVAEHRILAALDLDHPCHNMAGCDIARAAREGYVYTAAWLLSGATETPHLDACLAELGDDVAGRLHPWPEDFDGWKEFHESYGVKCLACEHYMYGDDYGAPHVCGNCGASM